MSTSGSVKRLTPVLLSGGAGTRLWPLSRGSFPKQLLPLASEQSMLQDTVARVIGPDFEAPLVVCNEEHRFIIAEQLRQLRVTPRAIVLEPEARNTAAATAVAALFMADSDPEALILVLPADHVVRNVTEFRRKVRAAAPAADAGRLVTFGVVPSAPETGYGYIEMGAPLPGFDGVHAVSSFVEKPDRETAERYLSGGRHLWNSGMFLFRVDTLLAELEVHAPEVLAACRAALAGRKSDLDFSRLDAESFRRAPSISIDYAVMERTRTAAVVPVDMGWTDVGSWTTLWEVADKDAAGNVRIGDVLLEGTRNCYVRSDNVLTALVGVQDVIVAVTDDAVLVVHRDQAQNVKAIVDRLKAAQRNEATAHSKVYRPWGFYQSIHAGERFQVKRLTVNPGARLSLQKHYHRAEHWVVVNGTALVTRGDEEILLRENESIFIPLGTVHRLANPGKIPLNLIEVQSGAYLGEDDIVRIEDNYGRQ